MSIDLKIFELLNISGINENQNVLWKSKPKVSHHKSFKTKTKNKTNEKIKMLRSRLSYSSLAHPSATLSSSSSAFITSTSRMMNTFRFSATSTTTKKASSGKAKVDPKVLPPPTLKDKIKKELWLVLKLNLVLVPLLVLGSLYFYPPQNPQKEKEMVELYKKSAGWKT